MRTPFSGPSTGPAEGRLALGMRRRRLQTGAGLQEPHGSLNPRLPPKALSPRGPARTQVTPRQREDLWEFSARSFSLPTGPALLQQQECSGSPVSWGFGVGVLREGCLPPSFLLLFQGQLTCSQLQTCRAHTAGWSHPTAHLSLPPSCLDSPAQRGGACVPEQPGLSHAVQSDLGSPDFVFSSVKWDSMG